MAESREYREKAERCRRLARDCTDESAREALSKLSDEYSTVAAALEHAENQIPQSGSDGT